VTIDLPPTAPTMTDPATFPARSDAWTAYVQNQLVPQMNAALGALGMPTYARIVDVAVMSNIGLAGSAGHLVAGTVVDGVTLTAGMRAVLVNQTAGAACGIYDVPASGAAARSIDANSSALLSSGLLIAVTRGTLGKGATIKHNTAVGFTLGSTALSFVPHAHQKEDTSQPLTSGSGATYTPSNWFVKTIDVKLQAGGGGGGAFNSGNSGVGGNSVFNGVSVGGGGYGVGAVDTAVGAGGSGGTGGTGATHFRIQGQNGINAYSQTIGAPNTMGGASMLGFPCNNGSNSGYGCGGYGATYTGSGGGGAGGEYAELSLPAAQYTYTVAAAGAAGSGSINGLAGSPGVIIVRERYN
jgi:hypothetical protein